MVRKALLPLLAAGMLTFAVIHVVRAHQAPPLPTLPVQPARAPFGQTVAGAGLVEPQTENIAVGSPLAGVVTEVHVGVGQTVKPGDPLFRLDDRALRAELKYRQAALAAAAAQFARIGAMPRPEDVPPSEARIAEARANLTMHEDRLKRAMLGGRAFSPEDVVQREQACSAAREQLARLQAEHASLIAGAWAPDKAVTRAAVEQARAQVEQTQTDLERLVVRALIAGEVLQVNVRPGEYAPAAVGQGLVVLGNVGRLHVRVDVDEHDITRFRPGAPARGMLRGDAGQEFKLTFVRVEPYVVPKRSLTGDSKERVDTRVLQVIYALEPCTRPVYVGQQLDVYIDARTTLATSANSRR